jgi:hypothetical protein
MKLGKGLFPMLALSLGLCVFAHAEETNTENGKVKLRAYVFVSGGAYEHVGTSLRQRQVGGGGEALLYKGLGVGAEISSVVLTQQFRSPGMHFPNVNLFSMNGSYHFRRNSKISPFITCGYSRGFGDDSFNSISFGGGMHYWFHKRIGLRLEFRDDLYYKDYNHMVASNWASSDRNMIGGIRFGLTLR